jgi:hypothetical protein
MANEFAIIVKVFHKNKQQRDHLGNIIVFNGQNVNDVIKNVYPNIPISEIYIEYLNNIFFNKCYKNNNILVSYEFEEPEFELDFDEENPPIYVALFHPEYLLPNNTEINKFRFSRYSDMKRYILKQYDPIIIFPVYMDRYNDRIRITTEKQTINAKQIGFIWITKEQKIQQQLNNQECLQEIESYIDYLNDSFYSSKLKIDIWDIQNEPGKRNFYLGSTEIDIMDKNNSDIEDIINTFLNNTVIIKSYRIYF